MSKYNDFEYKDLNTDEDLVFIDLEKLKMASTKESEEVIEEIPVETKRPSFLRETRFKEESTDDDVGVEITYDEERRNR